MSEQENIQIARRTFDYLNSHDLDSGDQYFAPNVYTEATGSTPQMNRDQNRQYIRQFNDAFPDLHFDIKDVVAQGDKVAVTWTGRGTNTKPLNILNKGSIPPTNKKAVVPGCTVYTFQNNKITRQEIYWDQLGLFMQLGVLTEQDMMARASR
jgi:steroid delta-isomerase-like uncharacterized protein